jgi:tight adherence protein B
MLSGSTIFIIMIFVTVLLMFQGMMLPVFGESAQARKRLKQRLEKIEITEGEESFQSLLRKKYLKKLSPMERYLESFPAMESLAKVIEQSGNTILAYRLVVLCLLMGIAGGVFGWFATRYIWAPVLGALVFSVIPYMKIRRDRRNRIAAFEEQLPEAIDLMKRALRAGHPFSTTLKLVATDMDKPVAEEFEMTFNDISYGNNVRRAMLGLLERVPSITVMALVTSILVQKETGGNLAEVLEQIAKVIRGRFRFHRRVKTLTAEGRMSAWVLAPVPFFIFSTIWVTTPDYLTILIDDTRGHNLLIYGAVSGVIGITWIRRILSIEV